MASDLLRDLWKKGEVLRNSVDKYTGEIAVEKYAVAIAYNTFSSNGGKINLETFNKRRTKLTETQLEEAGKKASDMITAIRAAEDTLKRKAGQTIDQDTALVEEARAIYQSGKFLEYLQNTFAKYWYGDSHILAWIAIQFVNSWLSNPNIGLHLHITGPSSTGKSDSIKAALRLLPEEYIVVGSFTRKAVVYKMKELAPGSTILHDDHVADEDEMELNRAIISAWSDGYDYISVVDGETHTVRLPARINRVITNTTNISSELSAGQDDSRFITIELSRNKQTAEKICDFIQEEHVFPEHEARVCQMVFKMIAQAKPVVDIQKLTNIVDPRQIRRVKQEMSTIKSVTVLNGRTTAIDADIKDANIYLGYTRRMLSPEIPGLGKNERELYAAVYSYFVREGQLNRTSMRLTTLKERSQVPEARFYEALRGNKGTFENPTGGLLSMIPGMHVIEEWDPVDRHNEKVLIFSAGTIPNVEGLF